MRNFVVKKIHFENAPNEDELDQACKDLVKEIKEAYNAYRVSCIGYTAIVDNVYSSEFKLFYIEN